MQHIIKKIKLDNHPAPPPLPPPKKKKKEKDVGPKL